MRYVSKILYVPWVRRGVRTGPAAQFAPIDQTTLASPQVASDFLARPKPRATNIDPRKLSLKQRQQHIAHSAFIQRKQNLPENRLPMSSECTKAPESGMSRAQIIEASYSMLIEQVEAMGETEPLASDKAMLEAIFADDPPPTRRAHHGAPGAPFRPLAIARRRAPAGECRWACEDDRFA